jgi:hypothetical protein
MSVKDNMGKFIARKQLRNFLEQYRITPDEAIRFLTEIKESKKGFNRNE